MIKDPALEYIKNEIIERCIAELYQHGLTLDYTVKEITEDSKARDRLLEAYVIENTERTENEKDFIGTLELWNRYEVWRTDKYGDNREVFISTEIQSAKALGMIMQRLGKYEKGTGKNGRGYKKLKWRTDSSKVKEFLNKFTLRTDDKREVNRIATHEVLKRYYKWLDESFLEESQRREKVGEIEFAARARKSQYDTNVGYINKEVINSNGKIKLERVGTDQVRYICNIKWLN